MKMFWSCLVVVTFLTFSVSAVSQSVSSSGSGAANTSISPGQGSVGANASQNAQGPGVSGSANASGNAQVSHEGKSEPGSGTRGSGNASATGTASAPGGSAFLSEGSTLNAELTKSVDCKKAKPGDEVTAKVTEDVKSNNKVIIHKGSKVIGHVTEAQARGKENSDSRLGIAFDKVVLSGGQEMAFNGVIQAIAPPAQALVGASADQSSDLSATGAGGGRMPSGGAARPGTGGLTGVAGGAVSSVGTTAGAATGNLGSAGGAVGNTVGGATAGLSARGTLTSASHGAVGLQGLSLNPATAGSAQGSLITSPKDNIKLDGGTQVLLRAAGSAQ